MNNFWILLKTSALNSLNLNKLKSKTGRPSIWIILLIILIIPAAFGMSFLYMMMIGDSLSKGNQPGLILSVGIKVSYLMIFLVAVTNISGYLFHGKDFDLLCSLPVKTITVFMTKLIYLLVINQVFFALIFIPNVAAYAIYNPTDWVFWVLSVLAFFLIPLLPITVAGFISLLLERIAPKRKFKNTMYFIISMFFVILSVYLSFNAQIMEEDPSRFAEIVKETMNIGGNFLYHGLHDKSFLEFLYFIGLSIVPFLIFVILLGKNYLKVSTYFGQSYVNKNFKMTEQNPVDQNMALVKKELKRYFGSPMYVMNTIVGPLLSTIMMLFVLFTPGIMATIEGIVKAGGSEVGTYLSLFLAAGFVVMLGMTSTTASAISIEGKQFWIMKTAPIHAKQVFFGKIVVNLIITIPFIIINVIACAIVLPIPFLDAIFLFLIPTLFVIFMSYIGLYINLRHPRFDYDSDVKVVKQSISVLITLGIGFLAAGLLIAGGFFATKYINLLSAFPIGLIISMVYALVSISLVRNKGTVLYNRLNG